MSKVKANPHVEAIKQYAEDCINNPVNTWEQWECADSGDIDKVFRTLIRPPNWTEFVIYRRKPATVELQITVPQPMKIAPEMNQRYWTISYGQILYTCWYNVSSDKSAFKAGFCFKSQLDATKFLEALSKGMNS